MATTATTQSGLSESKQQQKQQLQFKPKRPLKQQKQQRHRNRPVQMRARQAFLRSPVGLLASSTSVVGLLLAVCGAVHPWTSKGAGLFCLVVGLINFVGCSFDFFAGAFGLGAKMPAYTETVVTFFHFCAGGFSLVAFVAGASASSASEVAGAAIASAIFSAFVTALNIALVVVSYLGLQSACRAFGREDDDDDDDDGDDDDDD